MHQTDPLPPCTKSRSTPSFLSYNIDSKLYSTYDPFTPLSFL